MNRNQLIWQDRFNIGVESIDKEHKKLFTIMNRLLAFTEQDLKSKWVCEEGIKYFRNHAMKHFSEEEVYMASINYRGFETHRRIHDNFRTSTLPALEKELMQTGYSPEAINHFLGVCAGWLIGHTLTEDHAIVGKSISKWENLLPEEELEAMEETIIGLLYDLFQLNSKIISEHYGGEKFGKGIYYRLIYENEQGEKWETLMVFEEKVLMNSIGKLMSTKSEKLSVFLMNATRYTAQQFVASIKEHMPMAETFELKEESLLTYKQFQKIFEEERPQCSLLFDTGAGYFAYCMLAPHLTQQDTGVTIKAENAMGEIKKYLKKEHEKSQKKKILIVDDSSSMRQAMKELLENDYQVALAKSGLSAIRSITLDRPDLVLLDYEMPICDGRQVLQMIRSEEELADISVIFLTSVVDRERITKVLSLKPTGYLSKNLKAGEIKKNIDEFFRMREK